MPRESRVRLQIDLALQHQKLLHDFGDRLGRVGDAETARRIFEIVENLADQIRQGYKLAIVSADDERPDAVPELSRVFRPAGNYAYLVSRPHAWRRQLFFKGRRLTVGQFLNRMNAEKWTIDRAADEFELPLEAAYEALDYGRRYASLLEAEDSEDARAARSLTDAAAS